MEKDEKVPNPQSVSTMDKEVDRRLRGSPTNRAKMAIWPPPFLVPIHRPKPILNYKPHNELDLGMSQTPNQFFMSLEMAP